MVNNLYLVTPRGFCAGVEMAIKALTWMLKIYDETIYCYHEIVHNDWIVERFKNKNIEFIESSEELPKNAIVMLSAHGTSPKIENEFSSLSSIQVNAVCPLVTKVHHEAKKFSEAGQQIIYVGHKNHSITCTNDLSYVRVDTNNGISTKKISKFEYAKKE